jgi:hypothetical protein
LAFDELYQISFPWRRQWFVFDSLILYVGDTAAQILRMLPKLEVLRRDDSPLSFAELTTIPKSLRSLTCWKGFDSDTTQVDISSLRFPRLEKVKVESEKDSDLQFIATVLKNSIPQGRGFLKSLFLEHYSSVPHTTNSSVEYGQLSTHLIKVIEVRNCLSNEEGISWNECAATHVQLHAWNCES